VRRQPKYRVRFLALLEEDAMPSTTEITVSQLSRLIGLPNSPAIVDVRTDEDFASDPRLIPGSQRRVFSTGAPWGNDYDGGSVILVCKEGSHLSQGIGAWMRQQGIDAQTLEGGYEAWRKCDQLLVRAAKLPQRDEAGRTIWVTRARPKVVRIACPWLIRRFIDSKAAFLFVAPSEVAAVASRFKATPFDVADAFWGDRGEKCTFDVMIEEFGLDSDALSRLALIVRGADTGRLDLTVQSGGLLAASLGYSRIYRDDLAQLEAAMPLYDALYRWSRDASNETHA
jgi:rhodanese-related sulfurtransferase